MNSPFRGLRRSGNQSYPYPRIHTPVMVFRNNVRSVVIENSPESSPKSLSRISVMSPQDIKKNYVPKRRPPLNWAIPTIPESLSDESLKSILSQGNDEMGNFIIDNDTEKNNLSKQVGILMTDKNVINKETTDAMTNCELNEYDKKNNNFVDKFKIRKYWKKHQKNKSIEEKDDTDNRYTQIPRLKMRNILKMNTKEKDNSYNKNIEMNLNEKSTSQKNFSPKINTNYSNSILGKSPLITMAQKFRIRNRKFKDPIPNSSTNVNGSTSMDFMKTMFPTNVNLYAESLKRSQSLEDKTGQISEFYSKNVQQDNDTLEPVDEESFEDNYLCIYTSVDTEEPTKNNFQNEHDNNLSLIKENLALKINTSSTNINENGQLENTLIKNIKNEIKCEKVGITTEEKLNKLENDIQATITKQTSKLSFKSLFNNKKIKNEKIKSPNKKISNENNLIFKEEIRIPSCAEMESKLYLENPLNRPLVVPKKFGKCNNDYDESPTKDDKLLSCVETYAPLYFKISKVIGQEIGNDDDLCPLKIPKNNTNSEKLPLILKENYCKPFKLDKNELPENIEKCKEIDEYFIKQLDKTLQNQTIVEQNLKKKEEILEKAINLVENNLTTFDLEDETIKEAINCILSMNIDKDNDIQSLLDNSPSKESNVKNDSNNVVNDHISVQNATNTPQTNELNEELTNNINNDCNSISTSNNINSKLTNDAIYFASINSLSSGTSDIVIETSSDECDIEKKFSLPTCNTLPISFMYDVVNNTTNLCDSNMVIESKVIDNILPPEFIKSTYIPMIEDSIGSNSDIIEDKICKSGDGFKLDIQLSSHNLNNNDIQKTKKESVCNPKKLVHLSPYESVITKNDNGKNYSKPFKLKSNTSRKSGKQFFSFFLKNKKKHDNIKNISCEDKVRKAPLAQSECTRIANSPMIETPPISLIQKNCKTITDDVISGVPAVVNEEEYLTPKTPRSRGNIDSSAGLIDDELNDQPMLIGNSYSMNNLGSLTSFQIDNFGGEEEEFQSDLMSKSINCSISNTISNNELFTINKKGMAKSITDALIANNLKDEPESNDTISNEKIQFHSIVKSFNMTDDEKSDNSYNSTKENQVINNTTEEHILKCTENEETRIDIKLVEFENQPIDFSYNTYHKNLNFLNKSYETTNLNSIIKQLKQENKMLQDVIEMKDEEIKLLKEKLSIFINL
ncbi:Hypothetical protein SRAE_X000205100 [Strongyloides ratti]|uniref:Uncharacterized protein n=1 Tax=Strongyloides ratti TaxID=34506 RepID=A0A090MQ78_STRRB|nr:Hypothetical protein SRAE_X000205100 [Strongyloides ratti]CEF60313.1 Hypothetical protein SRAE_X000205100 [Strongyloides ratti]